MQSTCDICLISQYLDKKMECFFKQSVKTLCESFISLVSLFPLSFINTRVISGRHTHTHTHIRTAEHHSVSTVSQWVSNQNNEEVRYWFIHKGPQVKMNFLLLARAASQLMLSYFQEKLMLLYSYMFLCFTLFCLFVVASLVFSKSLKQIFAPSVVTNVVFDCFVDLLSERTKRVLKSQISTVKKLILVSVLFCVVPRLDKFCYAVNKHWMMVRLFWQRHRLRSSAETRTVKMETWGFEIRIQSLTGRRRKDVLLAHYFLKPERAEKQHLIVYR